MFSRTSIHTYLLLCHRWLVDCHLLDFSRKKLDFSEMIFQCCWRCLHSGICMQGGVGRVHVYYMVEFTNHLNWRTANYLLYKQRIVVCIDLTLKAKVWTAQCRRINKGRGGRREREGMDIDKGIQSLSVPHFSPLLAWWWFTRWIKCGGGPASSVAYIFRLFVNVSIIQ